jgi:hypothetical protein
MITYPANPIEWPKMTFSQKVRWLEMHGTPRPNFEQALSEMSRRAALARAARRCREAAARRFSERVGCEPQRTQRAQSHEDDLHRRPDEGV